MTVLTLLLLAASGVEIWAEPSLIHAVDPTRKSDYAMNPGRIQSARGESESLQVCVRAGRRGLENVRLDARPVSDHIGTPSFYRLGVAQSRDATDYWPDVLLPPTPFSLGPGEAAVFWVTYHIPPEAPSGNREHSLRLYSEEKEAARLRVRLEIFDFVLPHRRSLPALFTFDHRQYGSFYGLSLEDVEDWKPIYETIGDARISIQWRHLEDLVEVNREGAVNNHLLKKHLNCFTVAARPACIDLVGPGGALLDRFPAPRDSVPGRPDPLAAYLRKVADELNRTGWDGIQIVDTGSVKDRDQWPLAQRLLWRTGRAERRQVRLSTLPVHPYFEREVEAWALPLEQWSLELATALSQGRSLGGTPPAFAAEISASSTGPLPGYPEAVSMPEEAYDGSLFTAWTSVRVPGQRSPEWLEFHFASPITTQQIAIAWTGGGEATEIEVLTSFDGEVFTTASASWRLQQAMPPATISISEGTLRYSNTFSAIRLVFRGARLDKPVAVAEADFNPAGPCFSTFLESEKRIPRALWLKIERERFPSLQLDAPALGPRLAAWVCMGHGFSGILGGTLNAWPGDWAGFGASPPLLWPDAEVENLIYPGPEGILPSARLMRLRDGLEDYEYLVLLRNAVSQGLIDDPRLTPWAGPRYFAPRLGPDVLRELTEEIPEIRARIGRALSRLPKEKE